MERQDQLIEAFVARQVDGLIVVTASTCVGTLAHEPDTWRIVIADHLRRPLTCR